MDDPRDAEPKNRFASTQWSIVLAAAGDSTNAQHAMETLCEAYWYPLYVFARRRGHAPEVSEDLTQGFFAQVFEKHYFHSADPDRGRFRSFLLTIFKRYMRDEMAKRDAQKRGGGVNVLSIDYSAAERNYQVEPVEQWTPETLYERRWALTLLSRALERLQSHYSENNKGKFFELAQPFLTDNSESRDYERIATALSMTTASARVAVHRLRARYRDLLREEVASTLAKPEDCDDELATLQSALRGKNC